MVFSHVWGTGGEYGWALGQGHRGDSPRVQESVKGQAKGVEGCRGQAGDAGRREGQAGRSVRCGYGWTWVGNELGVRVGVFPGVQESVKGQAKGAEGRGGAGWGCRKMRGTGWAFREVWVWVGMVVLGTARVFRHVRGTGWGYGWALGQGHGKNSPGVKEV